LLFGDIFDRSLAVDDVLDELMIDDVSDFDRDDVEGIVYEDFLVDDWVLSSGWSQPRWS